jgi:hypothetical protein
MALLGVPNEVRGLVEVFVMLRSENMERNAKALEDRASILEEWRSR